MTADSRSVDWSDDPGPSRTLFDTSIRVLLVDDETSFLDLLAAHLGAQPNLEIVGTAKTVADALDMALERRPDVVVIDVHLPDGDGIDAVPQLKELCPDARILILTSNGDADSLLRAAEAGVAGWMSKDSPLIDTVHAVSIMGTGGLVVSPTTLARLIRDTRSNGREVPTAQRLHLTSRELDVLTCLGRGLDERATAKDIGITRNTCHGYIKSLYAKLGAHSQLEAVVAAVHVGLLPDLHMDRTPL